MGRSRWLNVQLQDIFWGLLLATEYFMVTVLLSLRGKSWTCTCSVTQCRWEETAVLSNIIFITTIITISNSHDREALSLYIVSDRLSPLRLPFLRIIPSSSPSSSSPSISCLPATTWPATSHPFSVSEVTGWGVGGGGSHDARIIPGFFQRACAFVPGRTDPARRGDRLMPSLTATLPRHTHARTETYRLRVGAHTLLHKKKKKNPELVATRLENMSGWTWEGVALTLPPPVWFILISHLIFNRKKRGGERRKERKKKKKRSIQGHIVSSVCALRCVSSPNR